MLALALADPSITLESQPAREQLKKSMRRWSARRGILRTICWHRNTIANSGNERCADRSPSGCRPSGGEVIAEVRRAKAVRVDLFEHDLEVLAQVGPKMPKTMSHRVERSTLGVPISHRRAAECRWQESNLREQCAEVYSLAPRHEVTGLTRSLLGSRTKSSVRLVSTRGLKSGALRAIKYSSGSERAALVEPAAVRYYYVCPWHGLVAWAPIDRKPPSASPECPECATITETWVGTLGQVADVSTPTIARPVLT